MLTEREITVGVVAYLDPAILEADLQVKKPISPCEGERPFVCLAVSGKLSVWMALTTKPGKEKSNFGISSARRTGGDGVWATGPCHANKFFATHVGPAASFVAASMRELPFLFGRPRIATDWVKQELLSRSRSHGSFGLHDWYHGCGGVTARTVALPTEPKIGTPTLKPDLVRAISATRPVPTPTPPRPEVVKEQPWHELIGDPPPGDRNRGKR